MRDLWYKDAVIYCLDVETFQDSNDDGVGEFRGLTERLDHLAGLGVTCLWLLPFYPTPNRDNGYDVIDYYSVDERLGSLGDFVEFMHQAHERGLRVIIDLVVNHTSIQHPWFQEARDPDSDMHDWYVWRDDKPEEIDGKIVFPGKQEELWTYDEKADRYYLHRFYKHQPDLNIANSAVREEIMRIMGFWLELGVSGFRVDAAPYMIELRGLEEKADVEEPYAYLEEFRDFLSWRRGDAIMLAEANVPPERVVEYFGEGHRMHMAFHFLINQRLFLAMAREEAAPLVEGWQLAPDLPDVGQWVHFVRNHDELTLDQLDAEQQQEVFAAFGPEEQMQIYGRGIRRRLAPMLKGDDERIRMAYSLMFSLPGTPVVRYGQEIGMGDDLSLEERWAVRTVMQWSDERNGGFSDAEPDELVRPVIEEGRYGYPRCNVLDQRRREDSLLNWMERVIRTRKEHRAFGWGAGYILDADAPAVFAHACVTQDQTVLAVHNLSHEPCDVTIDLSGFETGHLVDLLGGRHYIKFDRQSFELELAGYGYRWFRLEAEPEAAE